MTQTMNAVEIEGLEESSKSGYMCQFVLLLPTRTWSSLKEKTR